MLFILRTEQVLSALNMTIGQLDLLLAIPKHGSLSWQDQCIDFYAIISLSSLVPKVLQLLPLRVGWLVFETAFFCCEWMKFQVSWMLLDIDWPCFPIPPPCLSIIISRSLSYWRVQCSSHACNITFEWARRCWSKRTSCIIRWNFHNEVGGLQFCARVAANIKMMSSFCSDFGGKTLICDFGMFRTITGGQQRNTIPTHMTCALIRNTHTHSYSSHSTLIRPRSLVFSITEAKTQIGSSQLSSLRCCQRRRVNSVETAREFWFGRCLKK